MNRSLLVTLVLLAGCGGGDAETDPAPRVPVSLDQVRVDTLPDEARLTGRLTAIPGGAAVLTAPAAGVVRGLAVRIGSVVHAGETLATIDVPELAASAQQLAATAAVAEREAARQKALLADGVTAAKRADEANAAALSARAAADAAQRLQQRTRIATPLAGTVLRVAVREGERVEAGATITEVVSAGALDLVASVPAAVLLHLKVGQPVIVRAEGDTAAYPATLTALGPGIDSLTNAGQAVIRVPNTDHRLRPGLGATAIVRMGTHRGVLSVPEASLVVLGGETSIFIVGADTLAHARPVTPGVRHDGRVEVAGDSVRAGARVVTTGAAGLQDGMHVVAEKPAP